MRMLGGEVIKLEGNESWSFNKKTFLKNSCFKSCEEHIQGMKRQGMFGA